MFLDLCSPPDCEEGSIRRQLSKRRKAIDVICAFVYSPHWKDTDRLVRPISVDAMHDDIMGSSTFHY